MLLLGPWHIGHHGKCLYADEADVKNDDSLERSINMVHVFVP